MPKVYVTNPVTGKIVLIKTLISSVRRNPSKYSKARKKPKREKSAVLMDSKTGELVKVAEVSRSKKRKLDTGPVGPLEVPLPGDFNSS